MMTTIHVSENFTRRPVENLLAARSVAIVGASPKGRWPMGIYHNLKKAYSGKIFLVNPNYKEIADDPCYPNVAQLPEVPEHLLMLIPTRAVLGTLEEATQLGSKAATIYSAGFGEGDDPKGKERAQTMKDLCERMGFVICGPNCMGSFSLPEGLWTIPTSVPLLKKALLHLGLLPFLIFAAMTGLFLLGITSLVESSAVGAVTATLAALVRGRLTRQVMEETLRKTLSVTCMFMWIILAALCFGAVFDGLGAVKAIENLFIGQMHLDPWMVLILMQLSFILMGMFLDDTAMLVIVAPLYVPLVIALNMIDEAASRAPRPEAIAGRLERAGIAWWYKAPGYLSQIWEHGVRLFVDRERLEEARAIAEAVLSELQGGGEGSSSGQT